MPHTEAPNPKAIRQVLADHLSGRAAWDEVPALLMIIRSAGTGCALVPVDLPDEVWGHPAAVIEGIAAELEATPAIARTLTTGAPHPPLWGVALRYEGYVAEPSPDQARQRAARRALGLPVPTVRDMPGSKESRLMHARDITGRAYDLRQVRGNARVESPPTGTLPHGRIPRALDRLVTAMTAPT